MGEQGRVQGRLWGLWRSRLPGSHGELGTAEGEERQDVIGSEALSSGGKAEAREG